jgi:transcriptional regulator with XRE-family HTH domain
MSNPEDKIPQANESLGDYIRRLRTNLGLSQQEMAEKADIHVQSVGKIESGKTTRLNSKTKVGLVRVLGIAQEYLDAVCRGVPVVEVQKIKMCPKCWTPNSDAEIIWLDRRSKYCFLCGGLLRDRCGSCGEAILSLKFRFCPYCGASYKQ